MVKKQQEEEIRHVYIIQKSETRLYILCNTSSISNLFKRDVLSSCI